MRQFPTTGNPFKNMKNAFYFMLNALFFRKISKFLSWRFGPVRKWLDKKAKFDFKIYDVADWEAKKLQYTYWPNISKNKDNQAMKFSPLIT